MTATLAGADWLMQGAVARVLAILDADGETARVVGGAVRNALIGQAPGDIDIATTARPDEVMRRAAVAGLKAVPTGIAHGTVTLVVEGRGFEVTTLREDVETDGRRAVVRFGRDWAADAARRDFTINALSADRQGTVHDPVGGLADLVARRVRFIGDADARIAEDYLRILRFFRFHAGYGAGEPDAAGFAACLRGRSGLARLSRERVRAEILKLLVAPRAPETLVAMEEAGVIQHVLGSVVHHGAFARLVANEVAGDAVPDAVRRLAALAVRLPEDADRLRERLRLANAEHARLVLIATRLRSAEMVDERALLYRLGVAGYADLMQVAWAVSGAAPSEAGWRSRVDLPKRWTAPAMPIKAADLVARGLIPGPALGTALARAEAAWIAAGFPTAPTEVAPIADAAVRRG